MRTKLLTSIVFLGACGVLLADAVTTRRFSADVLEKTEVIVTNISRQDLLNQQLEYLNHIRWLDSVLQEAQENHDRQVADTQAKLDEIKAQIGQLDSEQ